MTLRIASSLLLFLSLRAATAQESPYFPPAGRGALHQKILDLENPALVMAVAAEPGQEDLRALAMLRLHTGARIVSVYLTNGGATPSDLHGELPNDVAGRRKEEAHAALSYIGGEAYFLNLPDVGVVGSADALEQIWQRDTVLARSIRMIRLLRPDALLLCRDSRIDEGDTVRWSLTRSLFLESVAAAGDSTRFPGMGGGAWRVEGMLVENAPGPAAGRTARDPVHLVWKKTSGRIAEEAGRHYASLRYQWTRRNKGGARTYSLPGQVAQGKSARLQDARPRLSRLLSSIRPEVTKACDRARAGKVEEALLAVVRAAHRIEQAVSSPGATLSSLDRRILGRWSIGLEDLRCLLLGIEFPYSVSDSILAPVQLMFLRFADGERTLATKGMEIIFPAAMSGEWIVNETEKYRLPLALPAEFRIVTPEIFALNTPPSVGGLEAPVMRTQFPFVVFHKDSISTRNFAFRRDIALRISPPQSVELLTPVVRITRGERLIVRLQNVSRETYRGAMWVGDSVARETRKQVTLNRKDAVVLDTLGLAWADSLPDRDYLIGLHIGRGKPVGWFLARKFAVAADTSATVGLITGIASSPVEDALRRMHIPCTVLDSTGTGNESMDRLRRIVLDRNALLLRADAPALAVRLARWVESGGHLVMLSQSEDPPGVEALTGRIGFLGGTLRTPDAPVTGDPSTPVCATPNALGEPDWQDWTIARARGTVRGGRGAELTVHVRDGLSGAPLVATTSHGKGIITAVALDLLPQFQTVQVGAYRLFANLLAY
jgi:hypothetical protein